MRGMLGAFWNLSLAFMCAPACRRVCFIAPYEICVDVFALAAKLGWGQSHAMATDHALFVRLHDLQRYGPMTPNERKARLLRSRSMETKLTSDAPWLSATCSSSRTASSRATRLTSAVLALHTVHCEQASTMEATGSRDPRASMAGAPGMIPCAPVPPPHAGDVQHGPRRAASARALGQQHSMATGQIPAAIAVPCPPTSSTPSARSPKGSPTQSGPAPMRQAPTNASDRDGTAAAGAQATCAATGCTFLVAPEQEQSSPSGQAFGLFHLTAVPVPCTTDAAVPPATPSPGSKQPPGSTGLSSLTAQLKSGSICNEFGALTSRLRRSSCSGPGEVLSGVSESDESAQLQLLLANRHSAPGILDGLSPLLLCKCSSLTMQHQRPLNPEVTPDAGAADRPAVMPNTKPGSMTAVGSASGLESHSAPPLSFGPGLMATGSPPPNVAPLLYRTSSVTSDVTAAAATATAVGHRRSGQVGISPGRRSSPGELAHSSSHSQTLSSSCRRGSGGYGMQDRRRSSSGATVTSMRAPSFRASYEAAVMGAIMAATSPGTSVGCS